jgi:hypothetical protein
VDCPVRSVLGNAQEATNPGLSLGLVTQLTPPSIETGMRLISDKSFSQRA